MKKRIIATFMVALMFITVLSNSPSVTAISISYENNNDKVKSDNDTFEFIAIAQEYGYYPYINETIHFVKITIRVEGEEKNRVQNTLLGYGAFFKVPKNKNISIINAEHWKYKYADSYHWTWMLGDMLVVEMIPKNSKTIDYPFLLYFPLLERFLFLLTN